MRFCGILFVCLTLQLKTFGQCYKYVLTNGWQALQTLEVSSDSLLIVGLKSKNLGLDYMKHSWEFTYIDSQSNFIKSDTFKFNLAESTTLHSAFAIQKTVDGNIFIGGSNRYDDSVKNRVGIFSSNLLLLESSELSTGLINFSYDSKIINKKKYLLGGIQTVNQGDRVKVGLNTTKNNELKLSNIAQYSWNHFQEFGRCNLIARNMLTKDNHLYISAVGRANTVLYANLQDGLILKVDTLGNEVWRLELSNDTTTYHNLLIAPLANGNFLATYQDYYHFPYMGPDENRWPVLNDDCTINCIEFTTNGDIIKEWNLKSQLSKIFEKGRSQEALFQHLEVTKDGSIIIIGNSHRTQLNYYEVGFALKLDKYGNYQWFRRYGPSLSNPSGFNQEELSLNGVTELSNGNLALAGEYKSDPSDSFPTGTQRGIVLFTDSFGCLEPGCQVNDRVGVSLPSASAQDDLTSFSIYPNPNNGTFIISNAPKEIHVFDVQGRKVNFSLSANLLSIESRAGIYYLRILREDGVREVHKVVVK